MLRFAIAFAVLALLLGVFAFSPVPASLAGIAKLLLFVFALLALISFAAHSSLDRDAARATSDEEETPSHTLYRGPLDRS
jgi:uncharacterized membrane protein YtjA (UPF0391 family)